MNFQFSIFNSHSITNDLMFKGLKIKTLIENCKITKLGVKIAKGLT